MRREGRGNHGRGAVHENEEAVLDERSSHLAASIVVVIVNEQGAAIVVVAGDDGTIPIGIPTEDGVDRSLMETMMRWSISAAFFLFRHICSSGKLMAADARAISSGNSPTIAAPGDCFLIAGRPMNQRVRKARAV